MGFQKMALQKGKRMKAVRKPIVVIHSCGFNCEKSYMMLVLQPVLRRFDPHDLPVGLFEVRGSRNATHHEITVKLIGWRRKLM